MTRKLGGGTRDRSWLTTAAMFAGGVAGALIALWAALYLRLIHRQQHATLFDCCPHPGADT